MLSAIIVAAGNSSRAGFDKILAKIAGRPVIQHAVAAFENAECVSEIIIVCRDTESMRKSIGSAHFKKVRAVVHGGKRRQDSVQAGLKEVEQASEFVAVHDAARPLIMPPEIERVFSAAQKHDAAVLAAPVTDTLKFADLNCFVTGSIDRKNVFAMQTPQIFRYQLLVDAYQRVAKNLVTITDEVSAIEHAGIKVTIVPAEEHNLKITFASDLPIAEFILEQRNSSSRA